MTCLLGDKSYTYSGIKRIPEKMPKTVKNIQEQLQDAVSQLSKNHPKFNGCFCNLYVDGTNVIGAHSDDEKDLDPNAFIASVSFGAERFFDIHPIKGGNRVMRIELKSGSVLLMGKNMQKLYKHSVPKQTKVKKTRINLTFRCFVS